MVVESAERPSAVVPRTEGIKYAGSKLKILPYIIKLINKLNVKTIFDGFSGTTRVSQALAQLGYKIFSNDIAVWSRIFATCYLLNKKPRSHYKELIEHLNSLPGRDGWFTENYGGTADGGKSKQKDGLKKPWQIYNTRRLDAVREEIKRLRLDPVTESVALTSLILAMDEVDSTLGHYAAYLRYWSPRSHNKMTLKVPNLFENQSSHVVFQDDVFNLIDNINVDLAYFDPPYGSNNEKMPPSRVRYASYYHLWTSVCLFDKPDLFGKSKRRVDTSDTVASSVFEEFRKDMNGRFIVVNAIEELIKRTRAKWIILSYSSGGRATAEEINEVINANSRLLEIIEIDYKKNVMSGMKWTNEWVKHTEIPNREFLFLMEKN